MAASKNETLSDLELDYFPDLDEDGEEDLNKLAEKTVGNFEFTDNLGLMRLVRLFFYLQVMSFMIDNPSIHLPVIFHIVCRGVLFYVIRFYSRPFVDAIYVIEYFFSDLTSAVQGNLPSSPKKGTVEVSSTATAGRRLQSRCACLHYVNKFSKEEFLNGLFFCSILLFRRRSSPSSGDISANFLSDHYWHSIKFFSHYILGEIAKICEKPKSYLFRKL